MFGEDADLVDYPQKEVTTLLLGHTTTSLSPTARLHAHTQTTKDKILHAPNRLRILDSNYDYMANFIYSLDSSPLLLSCEFPHHVNNKDVFISSFKNVNESHDSQCYICVRLPLSLTQIWMTTPTM
jgi:hypothetical protein